MRRGDIYRVRFGRASGREQAGVRPAVILQTEGLAHWSTVVVAPLSQSALPMSVRPVVRLADTDTRVLVDQLRAVDVERVGKQLGRMSADELIEIERATRILLNLR